MLAQGLLDFQYESNSSSHGLTSLGGLPVYIDLIKAIGLGAAIRRHVGAAGVQGWLDIQMVLAVIFLNLAGGDCVDDIEKLEQDSGFSVILRAIEHDLLSRAEGRSLKRRWRRERGRVMPSPSALLGWLERFHDPVSPKAVAVTAVIPALTAELRGLWRVNRMLLSWFWRGWFFHNWALDLTLDGVTFVDGDPAKGANIMVSNRGQLVLPATMRITFKDGTTNNVIIPVETWIQSASHTFAVDDRRPIASVVIDPDRRLPQRDRSHAVWSVP